MTFMKFSRETLKCSTAVKLEYECGEKCSISKENSPVAAQPTANGDGERKTERAREVHSMAEEKSILILRVVII